MLYEEGAKEEGKEDKDQRDEQGQAGAGKGAAANTEAAAAAAASSSLFDLHTLTLFYMAQVRYVISDRFRL